MKLNRDMPYQTDNMPFAVPTETGHVTGYLTIEGAQELADLLTRTERNIFKAVSKGQIQEIARGMLAKNWALAKEVDRLQAALAPLQIKEVKRAHGPVTQGNVGECEGCWTAQVSCNRQCKGEL